MKYKTLVLVLFSFAHGIAWAQPTAISLTVSSSYGNEELNLADGAFRVKDSTNLEITTLRFYVSEIKFLKDDNVVLKEEKSFHLIDASKHAPFRLSIENEKDLDFDEVMFNLGIDSLTNVSGVMGGDLDPTKGMYWTWQSGYINFKLEGSSNVCDTRNNEFVFHLGGYKQPNYCLQTISFPVVKDDVVNLQLDIEYILDQVELSTSNHIMSPREEAVELSVIVSKAFRIEESK